MFIRCIHKYDCDRSSRRCRHRHRHKTGCQRWCCTESKNFTILGIHWKPLWMTIRAHTFIHVYRAVSSSSSSTTTTKHLPKSKRLAGTAILTHDCRFGIITMPVFLHLLRIYIKYEEQQRNPTRRMHLRCTCAYCSVAAQEPHTPIRSRSRTYHDESTFSELNCKFWQYTKCISCSVSDVGV